MITIYDWFGYELPAKMRYRLIKQAGFDGVLMWWSKDFGRESYADCPEIIRRAGLFIENIHTPIKYQNYLWLDGPEGKAAMDCYLQCIGDCAEFDIPVMVVHLPDDEYKCSALGLERIKTIADKAEKLCVNVAMENLRNYKNLSYVLEHVDSKHIGFCYDCCHHNNYHPKDDLLSMYGSRLMALHLHDNGGAFGQHQLPFDGNIDWHDTMKNIADTGYRGATALEPMNWDYKGLSADEFLHKAYDMSKKLEKLRYGEFK